MLISMSKSDMLKGNPVTPGWYKATVKNFITKPPKTGGDSINYVPTFKLHTENEEELDHTFNSKAIGRMAPFIAALEGKNLKQVLDEMETNTLTWDSDSAQGAKLQIHVVNETYEGRLVNKIDQFLPYDAATPF